jgi:hypothetical protein
MKKPLLKPLLKLALGGIALLAPASKSSAQIGTGWTEYFPVRHIHLSANDINGGEHLKTFQTWVPYQEWADPVVGLKASSYEYTAATNTETFKLYDRLANRTEIRLQNEYEFGSRQFEGYVTFYAPLDDESLMQIWGSATGATQMMLRGFAANNGSIGINHDRVSGKTNYGSGTPRFLSNLYGKEIKVNIIHLQEDVGNKIMVYIDDVKIFEMEDNEKATNHGNQNYHKYGIYGTIRAGHESPVVKWRAVRHFKGNEVPTEPEPNPNAGAFFDITDNGGVITAQYPNTSKAEENFPSLIDNNVNTKYYRSGRTALWVQYNLLFLLL